MNSVFHALGSLADPFILFIVVAGTAAGIIVGALPGLGSVLAITLALPLTFVLPPEASIILLLALYCGSIYGGSLSAILINTPGTPQSAATLLDGFPMMKKGRGAEAMGWATVGSAIGGLLSTVLLILAAPVLAKFGLRFGPIEYFALGVFALTCVVAISTEAPLKGLLACVLGLLLATIGQDPLTGGMRLTFSSFELSAGIGLVPLLVGLFALSEVFWRLSSGLGPPPAKVGAGFKLPGLRDLISRWRILLRSALIGTGVGTLPGVGATAASLISYAEARRVSPNREQFGQGEPDGILASETANNAVTSGALVPTLALGIPGDPITAVMLGALTLQGVTPGPQLFTDNPDLTTFIFLGLFVVNIAMLLLGMAICPLVSRLIRIPEPLLLSGVVILIAIGTYSVSYNPFDMLVLLIAGIGGYALRVLHFPLAPIVIGFVLGGMIEQSLRQGLILTDGSFLAFLASPIAAVLFFLTIAFCTVPPLLARSKARYRDG
ncbi:tripartite tricarboxylate transporter permease [Roseinatronobacter alkalisoli]|uniref:Tripartite tricarboxylate transporter permease n=1 Tax=Roseinatronobacter alkalisoli TaxID=3028235 RepID=A0ABT5TEI4_9RHOB|nr:tripartite tricarboxylate transporter permease [Roseinatronobacter sp. HJB301]MDD7973527.1 tripartite tricarboxylate transporter permease [Roseinatronobacter sp. HJB301]